MTRPSLVRNQDFPRTTRERSPWLQRTLVVAGRRALAILAAVIGASAARALNPARDLMQYSCQTWTSQTGLPINGVSAIAQTNDGYLWLGATKGLVRFDGMDFTSFDIATVRRVWNSSVRSLAPARDGGLWVGLESSGFGHFDGHVYSFRSRNEWGGEHIDMHQLIEGADGSLWIAATNIAARVSPDGRYSLPLGTANPPRHAFAVSETPGGAIWFGTVSQGVFRWHAGVVTKIEDPELDAQIVFAVRESSRGAVWVATNGGVFGYDAQLHRIARYLPSHEVRALVVDRHEVVWMGSDDGLYRLADRQLTVRRKDAGLAPDAVTALCLDREDTLWVGTRTGLSHLTDVKFPVEPVLPDKSTRQAVAVAPSRSGGVWVAHDRGISRIDASGTTWVWPGPDAPHTWVKRVCEARDGDLYAILPERTVVVLAKGEVVARHVAEDMLVGLAEDEQGVLVSVAGELYRVNRAGLTPYAFKGPKPYFVFIVNLLVSHDGALWVATVNGVFRIHHGDVQHWGNAEGLTDPRAVTLAEDNEGAVWVGLLNGVARIKDGRFRLVDRPRGLFDTDIYGVVPDNEGFLWVDSGRGIFRVSRQEMSECAEGRLPRVSCQVFDGPDSVLAADKGAQERVGVKTPDGRIWFSSVKGVVVIDPARIDLNPVPPLVTIEQVVANGTEVSAANAVVAPGRGELQIHFNALTFIAPRRVHFRYRLNGYDADWLEVTNRRLAAYNNLRPGRYTFEVQAANADGVWSPTTAAFPIELQPQFYQTTWFSALSGGLVVVLLGGAYAARVRHLKLRERTLQENRAQLEQEVDRRTAELGQTNRALQHEVAERRRAEAELMQRTRSLELEIEERNRMQAEVERVHHELLEISRQAGMAEVATGVLHNVGNVLNSVNVSATLLLQRLGKSRLTSLARVAALLQEHAADLPTFLTQDAKGRQIPEFLAAIAEHLATEQAALSHELTALRRNVEHINEIVAMQQSYAKVVGVAEHLPLVDVVDDALRVMASAEESSRVKVVRRYESHPVMLLERHKLLQILVNLIRNAKEACERSDRGEKRITVAITVDANRVRVSVTDTGVGIPPENLTRVFAHGFTTRKNGHGFGLHASALAAQEMHGTLTVHSAGIGHGATFTLDLPMSRADGTGASRPPFPRAGDG